MRMVFPHIGPDNLLDVRHLRCKDLTQCFFGEEGHKSILPLIVLAQLILCHDLEHLVSVLEYDDSFLILDPF